MSIEFSRAGKDSLAQIVNLNFEIFSKMYEWKPYSLEEYNNKLTNKIPLIYLATDKDKLIGDVIAFERDDSCYIWILGVSCEYRHRGIGKKLLELCEQYAEHKYNSITLKVYNVSIEMQTLLKSRGYQEMGIEHSQSAAKYDAVHFKLDL